MKEKIKVKITITGTYTAEEIQSIEDFVSDKGYDNLHIIRMQYVGRNDKDDRRIYEGDIIKHKNRNIYKVAYCNVNLWWYLEGKNLPGIKGQDMRLHMSKVIGNIYDNPELLKGDIK